MRNGRDRREQAGREERYPEQKVQGEGGAYELRPIHLYLPGAPIEGAYEADRQYAGDKVDAPAKPGNATYRVIEPAPGRYVKERAELEKPAAPKARAKA